MAERNYVQWAVAGRTYSPSRETTEKLPPGFYKIIPSMEGLYFAELKLKDEELVRFPGSAQDDIIKEIDNFWKKEDIFRSFNIPFKRGILMHGPAGTGKTATLLFVISDLIKNNGIVLNFCYPPLFQSGMSILKEVQPETPVVVAMEDLDYLMFRYGEPEIINILDGIGDIDRTVFIATTNYLNQLSPRVANRPSRFDRKIEIGYPTERMRYIYIKHLAQERGGKAKIDIEKWAKETEGFSIAHLKELFIKVVIFGYPYDASKEEINKIKQMGDGLNPKNLGEMEMHD